MVPPGGGRFSLTGGGGMPVVTASSCGHEVSNIQFHFYQSTHSHLGFGVCLFVLQVHCSPHSSVNYLTANQRRQKKTWGTKLAAQNKVEGVR